MCVTINADAARMMLSVYRAVKLSETYFNRDVEQAFVAATKSVFHQKTSPYLLLASQVGNMYTPSLYGGLTSYLIRFVFSSYQSIAIKIHREFSIYYFRSWLHWAVFSRATLGCI